MVNGVTGGAPMGPGGGVGGGGGGGGAPSGSQPMSQQNLNQIVGLLFLLHARFPRPSNTTNSFRQDIWLFRFDDL
jgi:hypothetical protein